MKHTVNITILLLAMFVITQFIGLYVVNHYLADDQELPYGMKSPEVEQESDFYTAFLPSIIIAFIIAITLLFLLTKFKAEFILRVWFFIVVAIALGITLNSIIPNFKHSSLIIFLFVLPFAFIKIYKTNFLVHNITELLIYPGIAAVFVPMLNHITIIILLVLISGYDLWAVWHAGIMQKMAKYQIDKLRIFSGFFVPYASKRVKAQIKKLKKSELKKKKIKVNMAILGGGDIIFPIIAAGIMFKEFGIGPALFTVAGATLGLAYLSFMAKKKKWYPAMPFITAGIFLAMILSSLVFKHPII